MIIKEFCWMNPDKGGDPGAGLICCNGKNCEDNVISGNTSG